jgi:hypothetical protein
VLLVYYRIYPVVRQFPLLFGDFSIGDRIEAFSNGRWLRGTIFRVSNLHQTYTIRWPDRSTVSGYEARYIRRSDRVAPPIWRLF